MITIVRLLMLILIQDKVAGLITTEQGKTLPDARGDVFRGLGTWFNRCIPSYH